MSQPNETQNIVITAATGYSEEQIRPFVASLRHFSPKASLRLLVDERNPPGFMEAMRAWFPGCSFHHVPATPLRDFALKRKWARSVLKRLARWSGSRALGWRLLKICCLRQLVIRDLLTAWKLNDANILLCDSRDSFFQSDPFSRELPPLWTCLEDIRIEDCCNNAVWLKRTAGEVVFRENKHHWSACAGVIGGRANEMTRYLREQTEIIESASPGNVMVDGDDQGAHNYLVRERPDLGCTVLPNGSPAANLFHTNPADLKIKDDQVYLRDIAEPPAIVHQYDRHPGLLAFVQSRWGDAKPSNACEPMAVS